MRRSRLIGLCVLFIGLVAGTAARAQGASCREALAQGDRFAALRLCAQERNGSAVGQLLYELGAPFGAAESVAKPPLAWRADQASKRIRWSRPRLSRDPALRYKNADLALTRLQQLLNE